MDLAFYMPFKSIGHRNPSGDLVTGMELHAFLGRQGHRLEIASTLRSRWLYLKPWHFHKVLLERRRILRVMSHRPPKAWLSYHTYYKAPDLLGPFCSARLEIPYLVFQGIYSTKRKRRLKTLPGFLLNRHALRSARMVFTNKRTDQHNLLRLLPAHRVRYIAPGVVPAQFSFDLVSRRALKERWQTGNRQVILTAAMFRPGVKTAGIRQVIESCAELRRRGQHLLLAVIGDGQERDNLKHYGTESLGGDIRFLGKVPRLELYRYYSAADIFAFPGIQESLGMVYLEAQSSGLPVVAFSDWGAREAVIHNQTGLLSEAASPGDFTTHLETLLNDRNRRIEMREAAKEHIRRHHDLNRNLLELHHTLEEFAAPPA